MDFSCGDKVVYGIHGVCDICAIENKMIDRKQVRYYVLRPCTQSDATYYVPVNNQAAVGKMRQMLTRRELEDLLASGKCQDQEWIAEESMRKEQYRRLISRADCAELIGMISCLHRHKQELIRSGKKMHMCDENFMKDAQRLITAEVSQIVGIAPELVEQYIRTRLEM